MPPAQGSVFSTQGECSCVFSVLGIEVTNSFAEYTQNTIPYAHCCLQIRGDLLEGDRAVDSVQGSWLSHVEWERGVSGMRSKRVWDCASSCVHTIRPCDRPLPSDSRFREDLIALKVGPWGGGLPAGSRSCVAIPSLHARLKAEAPQGARWHACFISWASLRLRVQQPAGGSGMLDGAD